MNDQFLESFKKGKKGNSGGRAKGNCLRFTKCYRLIKVWMRAQTGMAQDHKHGSWTVFSWVLHTAGQLKDPTY